jgi:hypothetical protein
MAASLYRAWMRRLQLFLAARPTPMAAGPIRRA